MRQQIEVYDEEDEELTEHKLEEIKSDVENDSAVSEIDLNLIDLEPELIDL